MLKFKFTLITCDLMLTTLVLHKAHHRMSHRKAAHTNFDHEFLLVQVFLEFRGVSLLQIGLEIIIILVTEPR